MLRVLPVACLLLATSGMHGQVSYGGLAFGLMEHGPRLSQPPTHRLPAVDAAALIAEDEQRIASGKQGPYRFGFNHEVHITMDAGAWTELDNGARIWRLTLECPEAFSIGLVFSRYVIPEGALVFLYNEEGEQRGAYMAAPRGRTSYAMDQLSGERITIEYYEPAEMIGMGELVIGQVTHDYRDVMKVQRGFGDSGACNINVICPEGDDWRDQIRSVALVNTGGGFCTGTLINNCALNGIPYFLTADHCLGSPTENWIFRFNWDSPICDPTEDQPILMTISGAETLVNSPNTDVALLELFEVPPIEYDVHYSGWDISPNPAESVTGIHHPMGDIKKISHSFNAVVANTVTIGGQTAESWQVLVWDQGTTEQGSSGSGLWNQNGLLVGQLFGGAANCTNSVDDHYGRFDVSYPLLEPWLGACGTMVPGQDGDGVVPITVDAAVTSITNVEPLVCGTNIINPRITIKNNGINVITSLILSYGLVGGISEIVVWNGSLQPGQTVNYQLPPVIVPPGEHVLEVTSNSPNGEQDQVEDNDTWTFEFSVSSPSEIVNLHLNTDNYGADITWDLATTNGTVLYSGGPYQNGPPQQFVIPFCLTNGCYTFTINDEFGDGICCGNGEGNYVIQNPDSVVFAISDGQYGAGNVDVFCLDGVSVEEILMQGELSLFPNPTTGLLNVRFDGIVDPHRLSIFDGLGRTISSRSIANNVNTVDLDLTALSDGVYMLAVEGSQGRMVRRMVVQK
jgi:lysyl endopeptidase